MLCQDDSYRRKNTAEVLSCEASDDGTWLAALSASVLYPEGGGQPSDHGTVGGIVVLGLQKRADGVLLHKIGRPVEGEVTVSLDWARRFDHMQQHTGQHLLTAVAQDQFGLATKAFHLGAERCDIELDGHLSAAEMSALEAAVNAEIRAARPVEVRLAQPDELEPLGVRTRGLPEGFVGDVRLVNIEGVDLNTCGGTHLNNTAELQSIALTGTDSMRGGTRLFFLAGRRVRSGLRDSQRRERALSKLLTCPAAEHTAAVTRVMAGAKAAGKENKALKSELARLIGQSLVGVKHYHRDDGDMGFLNAVAGAATPDGVLLLTAGREDGVFLLVGDADRVAELGPKVADVLEGRGGGRGRFQGKATRMDRREELLALL